MSMILGMVLGGSLAVCIFAVIAIVKEDRWNG